MKDRRRCVRSNFGCGSKDYFRGDGAHRRLRGKSRSKKKEFGWGKEWGVVPSDLPADPPDEREEKFDEEDRNKADEKNKGG